MKPKRDWSAFCVCFCIPLNGSDKARAQTLLNLSGPTCFLDIYSTDFIRTDACSANNRGSKALLKQTSLVVKGLAPDSVNLVVVATLNQQHFWTLARDRNHYAIADHLPFAKFTIVTATFYWPMIMWSFYY